MCSHRPLICLLSTAHFTFALRCAYSFICLLAHSLPSLREKGFLHRMNASILQSFNSLCSALGADGLGKREGLKVFYLRCTRKQRNCKIVALKTGGAEETWGKSAFQKKMSFSFRIFLKFYDKKIVSQGLNFEKHNGAIRMVLKF